MIGINPNPRIQQQFIKMSDPSVITLKNAGHRIGNQWMVRHIDLTLGRGEIVTLIGPNGSGKSTTARLALGLLKPSEGKVQRTPGTRSAYVPQKLQLDWTLPVTVKRFMHLTGKLGKVELGIALEETGCAHLHNRQIQSLSGGELQRVLFARAIARKPDLLVLDEPAQGVDFSGEISMYEMIGTIRDRLDCAILLISHDLHVIMAATDRVLCLNGHVCCQGTPTAVASSPEYQTLFGHRAAGALAIYQHHHDHTHLPDGTVRHADGTITETCNPSTHDHSHSHSQGTDQDAG